MIGCLTPCRLHCSRTDIPSKSSAHLHRCQLLDRQLFARRGHCTHLRHNVRALRHPLCLLVLLHYYRSRFSWRAQDVLLTQLVGVHLPKRWPNPCNHPSWQGAEQRGTERYRQCLDYLAGHYVVCHCLLLYTSRVPRRNYVAWQRRGQDHGKNRLGVEEQSR